MLTSFIHKTFRTCQLVNAKLAYALNKQPQNETLAKDNKHIKPHILQLCLCRTYSSQNTLQIKATLQLTHPVVP